MSKIGSVFSKSKGKSKLMFGLVAVIAVAAIGIGISGGTNEKNIGGSITDNDASGITNTDPLGSKVTKEYKILAEKSNKDRIEQAKGHGTSAIPTIINLDNIIKDVEPEPESQHIVQAAVSPNQTVSAPVSPVQQTAIDPNFQRIYDEQEKLISAAFKNLNSTFNGSNHVVNVFASGGGLASLPDGNPRTNESFANSNSSNPIANDPDLRDTISSSENTRPKIPVGTIIPAITLTSINSDEPGPIRAKIIGGKLDGSILIGDFSINEESVSMSYSAITKDGNVATISAFAVDPDTSRTSMASNIDHHYVYRYGMFLSSAFLSGFGQAISSNGSTTVQSVAGPVQTTNPVINVNKQLWAGAATVGDELGTIAKDNYKTPNTITVKSGQLIGILFVDSADESWLPQLIAEGYE